MNPETLRVPFVEVQASVLEELQRKAAAYDALNQRQALKAEPAIEALSMIGEVLGLDEDDAGPTPIIDKIVCLQEAFETVKRLHLIATNQVVDLRKAVKPEPLSAAQCLPLAFFTYVGDGKAQRTIYTDLTYANARIQELEEKWRACEAENRKFAEAHAKLFAEKQDVPEETYVLFGYATGKFLERIVPPAQGKLINDAVALYTKADFSQMNAAAPEQAESEEGKS